MKFILYTADNPRQNIICHKIELWVKQHPEIILECVSIHNDPAAAIRLGITDLPALVAADKTLLQGIVSSSVTDEMLEGLLLSA